MENTLAVSVVVPMYNAEKYIADCLDSLLGQTFQDFELIVVNDCSTDSSRVIAESYLERFGGRMKIFDNEKNSGPSASRNNGLRRATGEYVYFMDSDDLLLLNGLEQMYSFAKQSDADFVSFTIRCTMSEDGKEQTIKEHKQPKLTADTVLVDYPEKLEVVDINDLQAVKKTIPIKAHLSWRIKIFLGRLPLSWEIWLKFLKRDFLIANELFFCEDIHYAEDHVWTYGIFLCAKKIVHVPRVIYYYRASEGSLSSNKGSRLQRLNLWVNTLTYGIKWIDNVLNRLEYFKQNPELRYIVRQSFLRRCFFRISNYTSRFQSHDIYESVKKHIGENRGGNDVLIAQLITYVDAQTKCISELEEKFNAIQNVLMPDKE